MNSTRHTSVNSTRNTSDEISEYLMSANDPKTKHWSQELLKGFFILIVASVVCVPVIIYVVKRMSKLKNDWTLNTTRREDVGNNDEESKSNGSEDNGNDGYLAEDDEKEQNKIYLRSKLFRKKVHPVKKEESHCSDSGESVPAFERMLQDPDTGSDLESEPESISLASTCSHTLVAEKT